MEDPKEGLIAISDEVHIEQAIECIYLKIHLKEGSISRSIYQDNGAYIKG